MPNDEEANRAIAGLNETELDGRAIVVKPANPRPAAGADTGGGSAFETE
jgi:RNA recognition motif-containing protein